MRDKIKGFVTFFFLAFIMISTADADTVYIKDGGQIRGIVVEDYHDRVILSTVDGEKEIKKADIKDIMYDRTEQNLVKLGDLHEKRGNLIKAYTYFRKAYQLNPDYKEAQDRFIHIRSVLLRRPEQQLRDEMDRRRALFKEAGRVYAPQIKETVPPSLEESFKAATGLVLVSEDEMPKVSEVSADSPAEKAGIIAGDSIVAIWGRLTGYIELSSLEDMIMASPTPEIMLSVRRRIIITLDPAKERAYGGIGNIGIALDMKEKGLTVSDVKTGSPAAVKGLAKEDLVISIDGKQTRYMPLADAIRLVDESLSDGRVEMEIARGTTLWRKEI